MKNVLSFREREELNRLSQVNEGLLSNISNLFTSNYIIKNKILKELLREVDCPISWKETKLRNSIYKLVDEFISTQSKAYTEELAKAKDSDEKESNGELVFDSETRFGSLKSKRLVEKADATLSALKNLVGTSKTASKDVAMKWAQIVYDESVIAIIQTAIDTTELDDAVKEQQLELVKSGKENVDKAKNVIHKANADYFKKIAADVKGTINDSKIYDSLMTNDSYSKNLTSAITKNNIDMKSLKDTLTKIGFDNNNIDDDNAVRVAVVSLCLNNPSTSDEFKKTIETFKKDDNEGGKKLSLAYKMCDSVLTELLKSDPDVNKIKDIKPLFGEKSIGQLTDIMNQIMSFSGVSLESLRASAKNNDSISDIVNNYNKLWIK